MLEDIPFGLQQHRLHIGSRNKLCNAATAAVQADSHTPPHGHWIVHTQARPVNAQRPRLCRTYLLRPLQQQRKKTSGFAAKNESHQQRRAADHLCRAPSDARWQNAKRRKAAMVGRKGTLSRIARRLLSGNRFNFENKPGNSTRKASYAWHWKLGGAWSQTYHNLDTSKF